MVLSRCACALVVLAVGLAVVASAQTSEKTFPTVTEINLVLTQTERAIEQYAPDRHGSGSRGQEWCRYHRS